MNHGMSIKDGTLIITLPEGAEIERVEVNGKTYTLPSRDVIDRQEAIEKMAKAIWLYPNELCKTLCCYHNARDLAECGLKDVPSAQPERTCVNCGRTANNGGWYADGGTRCPIEEHYALPKDGYCHLWEKRNVTDDDYPERREE